MVVIAIVDNNDDDSEFEIRSLAGIFKHGTRKELEQRARTLFQLVPHILFPTSDHTKSQKPGIIRQSSIVRQLGIKLIQRMGMILVPPRVVSARNRMSNI